ncbi:MAG: ATP-binding cassette domain-containing protein [Gammaproteobacteria bacterium]|nr:ATP-binding cassette domain-containing protein [Gammaproteobacteria bacterium]
MCFDVARGEIFGLVGESGCGKSVTGMAVLNMIRHPGSIVGGRVVFDGEDLVGKSDEEMMSVRGRRIAMVFQDPAASLNPVFTIGQQMIRLVRLHRGVGKPEAVRLSIEMLGAVGLRYPEQILRSYPHELSGGMQQRVMIGMALACGAEMIIADEPTAALDVTIQAQFLDLLLDLREREGLSIVLITHDLAVVAEVCDRVAVAYAGKVVEQGSTIQVLTRPGHPYTSGLLAALPEAIGPEQAMRVIEGSVPDGLAPIEGCAFRPRCPEAMNVCRTRPPWVEDTDGHGVACHLPMTEVRS